MRDLYAEVAELREALREQWLVAHSEHCSNGWPHPDGEDCYWPPPDPLLRAGSVGGENPPEGLFGEDVPVRGREV